MARDAQVPRAHQRPLAGDDVDAVAHRRGSRPRARVSSIPRTRGNEMINGGTKAPSAVGRLEPADEVGARLGSTRRRGARRWGARRRHAARRPSIRWAGRCRRGSSCRAGGRAQPAKNSPRIIQPIRERLEVRQAHRQALPRQRSGRGGRRGRARPWWARHRVDLAATRIRRPRVRRRRRGR